MRPGESDLRSQTNPILGDASNEIRERERAFARAIPTSTRH